MGFNDRDYYREDDGNRAGGTAGDLSITFRLIIICATVFLVDMLLFHDTHKLTFEILSLQNDTPFKPWLWFQYLTYGFTHDPNRIWHIVWNMFALYFFGREMEQMYGRREYLRFYLAVVLLGGLLWSLRSAAHFSALGSAGGPLIGADGAATAVTLLFCCNFPQRNILLMGVLPVPAWLLGTAIVVVNLSSLFGELGAMFSMLGPVSSRNADPTVAAIAFTALYFNFRWRLSNLPGLDWISSLPRYVKSLFRSRPRFKVVGRGDDDDDDAAYQELETQADRILAKLHRDGESSLSTAERKLLERYSRLMRQKHR